MSRVSFKRVGGSVLPLLLILLAAYGMVWLDQPSLSVLSESQSDQEIRQSLAAAKQALIAYAISYADNYQPTGAGIGHLPCPDHDPVADGIPGNDGPDPPCGHLSEQIGRLPRQTFTYSSPDPLEPGAGVLNKRIEFYSQQSMLDQRLWYIVSSAFVNNPHTTVVNSLTRGTLSVDQQGDVVAIVIAPGEALYGQHLSRPGDNVVHYLEGENADGDFVFSSQHQRFSNDRLIYITASELGHTMEKRVVDIVVQWLHEFNREFCDGMADCYPYAALEQNCEQGRFSGSLPLLPGSCQRSLTSMGLLEGVPLDRHWFLRNGWHKLIRYALDPECLRSFESPCEIEVSYGSKQQDGRSLVSIQPASFHHDAAAKKKSSS